MELQKELGIEDDNLFCLNNQLRTKYSTVEVNRNSVDSFNLKIEFSMITSEKVQTILAAIKPFIE